VPAPRARIALICLAALIALVVGVLLLVLPAPSPGGVPAAVAATATPVYPIPTPTPSPSPTPTPPPSSSLSLAILAVRTPGLYGRTLVWSVRCLPHACHATLVVRVKIGGERRFRRLATVHRRVPSARDRRVAVRVSRKTVRAVRAAWRRHRRVVVDLRGVASDGHNTASFRLHKRLRRPR
jgi:hypothetical protein